MIEAIVLAGGLGTRLRSVVPDLPKPMAPVNGRPFLAFVLDQLVDAGFATAILAVGYRHESIRTSFGEQYRGLALRYSVEDEPLGTGGAMRQACTMASAGNVFVLNGDTYVECDYQSMLAAHRRESASLTIGVHEVPDVARYGAVLVDGGRITGFGEKGRHGPGSINAGLYLMSTDLLDGYPASEAFSFEADFLAPGALRLQPLAFVLRGAFLDIGVPDDYARAGRVLPPPRHGTKA